MKAAVVAFLLLVPALALGFVSVYWGWMRIDESSWWVPLLCTFGSVSSFLCGAAGVSYIADVIKTGDYTY